MTSFHHSTSSPFSIGKVRWTFIAMLMAVISFVGCKSEKPEASDNTPQIYNEQGTAWKKYTDNPVVGNEQTGTCFDANVITQGAARYNMYFSWRPQKSIAVSRSDDGFNWSEPQIVLSFDETSGWEDNINRSCTLFWNGKYHMWYTGQARGYSKIGYAVSDDGVNFTRISRDPVLIPEYNYEGYSVMNPYVIRDDERGIFRMWYASGETFEPNVLCYAESTDGIHWQRSPLNPVFVHGNKGEWDQDRVGGCEVHRLPDGTHVMFYIGYSDIYTARIGYATSADGIREWKRSDANPIIEPTPKGWDADACYKPTVVRDEENNRWLLWYNGRNEGDEFIGCAIHEGLELE